MANRRAAKKRARRTKRKASQRAAAEKARRMERERVKARPPEGGTTNGDEAQRGRGGPGATYDIVQDKQKRMSPRSLLRSEDDELPAHQRRSLVATLRDQERNIALARWMIELHLAYVTGFSFQAKTKDTKFNDELEAFIREVSTAKNFDVAAAFDRQSGMTMLERRALVDGDAGLLKLESGHAQFIEGDRIALPTVGDKSALGKLSDWTQGVKTYKTWPGRPKAYCICKRKGSAREFDKVVRAVNLILHAKRHRFDQLRGTSPLAAAGNMVQDLYEDWDYHLIKDKLHALLGVAVTTKEASNLSIANFDVTQTTVSGTETDDGTGNLTHETREHVIKPGVATILDLTPAEKIETIESKHPPGNFVPYAELMIKIALLAVGIPEIFFDARRGSYSVHKTANIQYDKLCKPKRRAMQRRHDEWTVWRVILANELGELTWPRGWTIRDVAWEWQPDGTPWLDPPKEVKADRESVAAAFNSPQRVCKARGLDFHEIVDEISDAQDYAREKGVELDFGQKQQQPPQDGDWR